MDKQIQGATGLTDKLECISSFGYGAYSLPSGQFAIADPFDDEEGYYITGANLEELANEIIELLELNPTARNKVNR